MGYNNNFIYCHFEPTLIIDILHFQTKQNSLPGDKYVDNNFLVSFVHIDVFETNLQNLFRTVKNS